MIDFNLFNKENQKPARGIGESKAQKKFRDNLSRMKNLKEFARSTFAKRHKSQENRKSVSRKCFSN